MTSDTKQFKLPREVAIFPLPNLILFPKVEIPLYIFEPRYRKMLSDTMKGNKFIALSLLQKGWEGKDEPYPSHDVVGIGLVKAVVENRDGTSHILLKGIARAQVIRYTQTSPYCIARVRLLPDRVKDSEELKKLAQKMRNLFIKKLRLVSEKPGQKIALPRELTDPVTLSHFVSFTAQVDPYLKQDLFETTDVNCRVKHLISILEEELYPPGTQN